MQNIPIVEESPAANTLMHTSALQVIRDKITKNEPLTSEEYKLLGAYNRYSKIGTYKLFAHELFEGFDWQWFHEGIMERIDIFLNTPNDRLIITMPPQHGKTLLAGLGLMAYIFGRYPELVQLYLTCNEDRATSVSGDVLDILTGENYKKLFPQARVKSSVDGDLDRKTKKIKSETRFLLHNVNSKRGRIKFSSLTAGIAGNPGDIILIDDPIISRQQAESPKEREMAWKGLYSNVLTRAQEGTRILIISTHWHADDLIGRLREINKDNLRAGINAWDIINFPDTVKNIEHLNPKWDKRTQVGELLWPKYEYKYKEAAVGDPVTYACMYQGRPIDYDGIVFKKEFIKEYYTQPSTLYNIVISVDTNFKKTQDGSKCGIVVYALSGTNIYLLEFINKSYSYVEMRAKVAELALKYDNYWQIIIEEKANGYALIDDMRRHFTRIYAYDPKGLSKMQRAQAVLPLFTDGRVFFPTQRVCLNIDSMIEQFISFNGLDEEQNDLVDATSQCFLRYIDYFKSLNIGKIHSFETTYSKMFGLPSQQTLMAVGLGTHGAQKYKGKDRFGFSIARPALPTPNV